MNHVSDTLRVWGAKQTTTRFISACHDSVHVCKSETSETATFTVGIPLPYFVLSRRRNTVFPLSAVWRALIDVLRSWHSHVQRSQLHTSPSWRPERGGEARQLERDAGSAVLSLPVLLHVCLVPSPTTGCFHPCGWTSKTERSLKDWKKFANMKHLQTESWVKKTINNNSAKKWLDKTLEKYIV